MNEMTSAKPALNIDEALALLGVESLPGLDERGARDLLESMARMLADEGEEWIRENRDDLLVLWSAMLSLPSPNDES